MIVTKELIADVRRIELPEESSCGFLSPLGFIRIAAKGNCISEIAFSDALCNDEPVGELAIAVLWLKEYFAGNNPQWRVRISDDGTEFEHRVWDIIDKIPYGETMTYGEIKLEIVKAHPCARVSAQAVGGAVGRNKFAILRPCHRVMGAKSSLTGYKWGLDKKRFLLDFEKHLSRAALL